jgi:DNA-binding transcriptional regulator YdaS (Cro superfamily)
MTLSEYIKAARGNATDLAAKLKVHKTQISNWANFNPTPPPHRCIEIVRATGGLVSRKELRPQDWQLIWPEDKAWDGITERRANPPCSGPKPGKPSNGNGKKAK